MTPRKTASRPVGGDEGVQKIVLDALRRLVRSFRVGSHDGGPSPAQRFVLERLAEHPGASIGELARMTHTDQSSVSVVVSRLVEGGFVERRRSHDDARRAELSLTTRGRALAKKSVPSGQAQLLAGISSLSNARRAALARELEALVDAMGIRDEPAGMFFERVEDGRARAAGRASGARRAARAPAPRAAAGTGAAKPKRSKAATGGARRARPTTSPSKTDAKRR